MPHRWRGRIPAAEVPPPPATTPMVPSSRPPHCYSVCVRGRSTARSVAAHPSRRSEGTDARAPREAAGPHWEWPRERGGSWTLHCLRRTTPTKQAAPTLTAPLRKLLPEGRDARSPRETSSALDAAGLPRELRHERRETQTPHRRRRTMLAAEEAAPTSTAWSNGRETRTPRKSPLMN